MLRMIRRENVVAYRWGELVRFAAENSQTRNYQAEGWAPPEQDHTWTNGKRAKIVLPVSAIDSPITLQARLSGFLVPGKLDHQTVRILVNQHLLGERSIKTVEPQEIAFRIPPEYLAASSEAVIVFEMPGAASPASLGIGSDVRELGVAVAWLKLTPEIPQQR